MAPSNTTPADEMDDEALDDDCDWYQKYIDMKAKYEAAQQELDEMKRDFKQLNEKYVCLQIKHADSQSEGITKGL
ncbi:hypothetical protein PRZ48_013899 [Zasmidium cellare]|uniref:Uncharacterized protein n=1 Tax=Zasmidium cellare TaxID=395010 RepID=A0ABR0DZY8_ZASCE|nr:hypothetical protein PRZ48_013899 [Zasmidium cellare]